MNWLEEENTALRTSLDGLRTISADDFPEEHPIRVDVTTPEISIPLLVVKREHADRLTVLNNGAMDLKRSQGRPIFQRSSWWQEINTHQIYVCDPGTVGTDALPLNWMQGTPPLWVNLQITKSVRIIAAQLGIRDPKKRTYFGSSAGGFAALLQLCADKQAGCLINNSQFDWTRWYAHQVTPVLQRYFPGRTAAEVRRYWPHRANALKYLLRTSDPLNITYHVNMASSYDTKIQLPIFENLFSSHQSSCGSVNICRYYDKDQGHNPLLKGPTLNLLNSRK